MNLEQNIDRIEYAWKVYSINQNLIQLADTKTRYLFIVSGVSTTYILTEIKSLDSITFFHVVFFLVFLSFLWIAFKTINPREAKYTPANAPRLIYHKHINKRIRGDLFLSDFERASEKELLHDLLFQIYEVSHIAENKFKYYKYSFRLLIVQTILFFVLIIS